MFRKVLFLCGLLALNALLVGFTPLQDSGGFELKWWYLIIVLIAILLPALFIVSWFASGDAPSIDERQAEYEKAEQALAAARAASRQKSDGLQSDH